MKINKKFMAMFIGATLAMSSTAFAAETYSATPSNDSITLNGSYLNLDGYQIDGNNYYKLRDLAHSLRNTKGGFSVSFNGDYISIDTSGDYTPVGGECESVSNKTTTAKKNNNSIYVDNSIVNITAYEIDGYNYFKLRDLCGAVGVEVGYDDSRKTISLVSKKANNELSVNPLQNDTSVSDIYSSGSWITPEAQEMLGYINELRATHYNNPRMKPLELNEDLCHGAMIRASEATVELAHTRPNGTMYATVMDEISPTGYNNIQAGGENLVFTVNSAKEAFDAWYKSPGHHQTMVDWCFTKLGVGFNNGTWVLLLS